MRIYLIGYMYSGKTTLGRQLAARLGLPFHDLDQMLEARYHSTVPLLFERYGEAAFRQLERAMLHSTAQLEHAVIATGGGTPCHFDNMDFILAHGTAIYLELTADDILRRALRSHKPRPLLSGLTEEEQRKVIERQLKEREPYYRRAPYVWSDKRGSNPRPAAWEAAALPTELLSLLSDTRPI